MRSVTAKKTAEQRWNTLQQVKWENIGRPGAYVEIATGDLYRFPPEALATGSSPLIHKVSLSGSLFLKVSDSPYVTSMTARLACAQNNVQPRF